VVGDQSEDDFACITVLAARRKLYKRFCLHPLRYSVSHAKIVLWSSSGAVILEVFGKLDIITFLDVGSKKESISRERKEPE